MYSRVKLILLLILFGNTCIKTFSQRNEFGGMIGASYYIGDINPKKHFIYSLPALGLIYRYNLNPRFAYRNNIFIGFIQADDSKTLANKERNLSFRSYIGELNASFEFNFFPYVTGHKKYFFSPYIFGGFVVFGFQPKTKYNGEWYNLQPLSTEGQETTQFPDRKKYSLISIGFPFGMGFKYSLSDALCFSIEWGMRKTDTDYIDDVSKTYADSTILATENSPLSAILADRSTLENKKNHANMQRGNSKNKDWYSFYGIIFTYKINKTNMCASYKKSKPVFYY